MAVFSATKVWEPILILTELKSYLIQFTHTKQRGTIFLNTERRIFRFRMTVLPVDQCEYYSPTSSEVGLFASMMLPGSPQHQGFFAPPVIRVRLFNVLFNDTGK